MGDYGSGAAPAGFSQLNHHHLAPSFPRRNFSTSSSGSNVTENFQDQIGFQTPPNHSWSNQQSEWIMLKNAIKLKMIQERLLYRMHLTKNGCNNVLNPNAYPSMVLDSDYSPVSNVTFYMPSEGFKVVGCCSSGSGGLDPLPESSRKRKAAGDDEKKYHTMEDIEKFLLKDDDEESEQEQPKITENHSVCHPIQQHCWTPQNPMSENPHLGISTKELIQIHSTNSGDVPVSRQSMSSSRGGRSDLVFKRQKTEELLQQQVEKEKEINMLDSDSEDEERPIITHQQRDEVNNFPNDESSKPAEMRSLDDERDWHFLQEEIWIVNGIVKQQQPGIWFDQDYYIPDDSFPDILPLW